jgi:hypothetical protein
MKKLKEYGSGTVLFAGSDNALEEAKDYCKVNKLTFEDVKIIQRGEMILVVLR